MEHVIIFLHLGATMVYVKKPMYWKNDIEGFAKKCNGLSVVYIFTLFKFICPLIMKMSYVVIAQKNVSQNRCSN
jgi:hypothetical protein